MDSCIRIFAMLKDDECVFALISITEHQVMKGNTVACFADERQRNMMFACIAGDPVITAIAIDKQTATSFLLASDHYTGINVYIAGDDVNANVLRANISTALNNQFLNEFGFGVIAEPLAIEMVVNNHNSYN